METEGDRRRSGDPTRGAEWRAVVSEALLIIQLGSGEIGAEKIGRKGNSPVLSVPENSNRDVDSVLGNKNSDRFQRSLSSILD